MKKLFILISCLLLVSTSLFAYEVVFSEENEGYFTVYDDEYELVVDDNVHRKRCGDIKVEQWEDKIYTLYDDRDEVLIICLSNNQTDIDSFFRTFNNGRYRAFAVITNTEVSIMDYLKPGHVRYIFTDNLSKDDIVKAKKKGIRINPFSTSVVYDIDDDTISFIDSNISYTKVVCPNCGTIFYI